MIPRIEQKIEINKYHYPDLLKWIHHKGGRVLYPERIICSRYFDNQNKQIYASPADETPSYTHDCFPNDLDITIAIDRIQKATIPKFITIRFFYQNQFWGCKNETSRKHNKTSDNLGNAWKNVRKCWNMYGDAGM